MGIGIPKNRQIIFERFIQADVLNKMASQGTGLDYQFLKHMSKCLGKTMVESEEEKGSTFYFTLPYQPKK
jgi:signal transduction histidine kinase